MEPTQKEFLLTYLEEVISHEFPKIVGKVMKRFEVFLPETDTYDDKKIKIILPLIKKEIKELLYESSREFTEIFNSYAKGLEKTYFKFIKKE